MPTLDDYRKRPHWSYSSLNGLLNICSLQWAFERVYKIPKQFTPLTLSFGNTYHRVMEWIGMERLAGKKPAVKAAGDLFMSLWERQVKEDATRFDEGESAESCGEQGRGLVACMLDTIDPDEEVLGLNEAFAVPLTDADGVTLEKPLIGEIDCVVRASTGKTMVDWKTAARRWPKDKAATDLQATTFCHAYRLLHDEDIAFRFDVAVKNKTPVYESHITRRDPESGLRLVELAKKAEMMVEHGIFFPSDQSFYCGTCPFTEACRNWHREAARRTVQMAA